MIIPTVYTTATLSGRFQKKFSATVTRVLLKKTMTTPASNVSLWVTKAFASQEAMRPGIPATQMVLLSYFAVGIRWIVRSLYVSAASNIDGILLLPRDRAVRLSTSQRKLKSTYPAAAFVWNPDSSCCLSSSEEGFICANRIMIHSSLSMLTRASGTTVCNDQRYT